MQPDRLLVDLGQPSRWWLEEVTRLDEQLPGFAGAALRASNARKLLIAASLSQKRFAESLREPSKTNLIGELLTRRHKHLLKEAFGSCPPGFRGAIVRLTSLSLDRSAFAELHRIFSQEEMRSAARTLMQCKRLVPRTIELCLELPPAFRRPRLVKKHVGADHEELLTVLSMARVFRPELTQEDLRSYAKWLGKTGSVPKLLHKLIEKASLPADPVGLTGELQHVQTVEELKRVSRQFRNCVGTLVIDAIAGRSHFYVGEIGKERAVAHVQQLAGRNEYVLSHVEPPKGELLSRKADQAIEAAFHKRGVQRLAGRAPQDPWWIIERVFRSLAAEELIDEALLSDWDDLQLPELLEEEAVV
ncbi:hypothetical protein [Sphingomonas sp. LHG3406-1]|uniref:hypothetical protein n=1 Tax=Sphingomonas sp. LHG3406-1 TaxID=2804617 RepID=UPI00260C350A|nr:hypothetical protein [Sphingomonas sp. LHG3406-1]